MSVMQNSKQHSRGGVVSFLAPGQDKYTRLRASTLGVGFDPKDIQAVIAGEWPLPEFPKDAPPPPRQVGLIIDIQKRMAQGKGPAYERWAKVYNLKQMAAALQFLQENNLTDYDALAAKTSAAVDRAHALAAMNELLGGEKLPKMDALKRQRRELADKKKALYAEYRQAQRDMRQAVAVKANIDHLLGLTDGRDDKEQTR